MPTLLEKAQSATRNTPVPSEDGVSDEEVELIEAYLKGIVTARQASEALGHKHPGSLTSWIGTKIRRLYKQGRIQINKSNRS